MTENIQIIQARSYVPGIIGLVVKSITGKKVVFDPRGLIPEELQLTQKWTNENSPYQRWKSIEKQLLEKSDAVIVLSEPFAEHYKQIVLHVSPIIVPCCVDTAQFQYDPAKRISSRKKHNLDDKFAVLFVMGHFVPYQDFDKALDIFKQIRNQIVTAHFLILTSDVDPARSYLKELGVSEEQYSLFSVSFGEMPDYISMADMGLLVRTPSIISRVSSPVKFGEYLSCGIPVLSQPGIGDTEKVIVSEQVGNIIQNNVLSNENVTWLNDLRNSEHRELVARRCRETAIKYLSWEVYLETYRDLYKGLARD